MNKTIIIILVTLMLFFISAGVYAENTTVHYFYGQGCIHCAKVEASGILEEVAKENINVIKYECYFNSTNAELFNKYADLLSLEKYERGFPFAVIECSGKYSYLLEDDNIINNLKPACMNASFSDGDSSPIKPPSYKRTIIAVIIASIADGLINPCALGVLAFLLIMLSSIGSKKKMIKISSVYICTIYIVYFLSGLGLFSAFQSLKITNILYTFGAIFLIIAGLINIKDFFWYGKGISLAIPASKKPIIEKYTRMATIPSAIILGFLVAIFELPCTGAWYLSILGMLADNMNRLKAIPLLLLYNFLFVLPLMIITFIVIKGFPPEKINQFSENKKKIFRLISGLIMLGLGIAMLIPGIF